MCHQKVKMNSEDTRGPGCQVKILCPIGDKEGQNYVGESSSGAVPRPEANHSNTNNTNSTWCNVAGPRVMRPRAIPVICHDNDIITTPNRSDTYIKQYRIDFTNWHFVKHDTGSSACVVHIPNLQVKDHDTKFYNFHTVGGDSFISICDRVPEGLLSIQYSEWFSLQFDGNFEVMQVAESLMEENNPKIVFENYQKDCLVQHYFKMPYETYMGCIIDNIINHQDQMVEVNNSSVDVKTNQRKKTAVIGNNTNTLKVNNISECAYSHPGLVLYDHTTDGGTIQDVYLPDKSHGHISLSREKHEFIGPDREPIEVKSTHQYLKMAETIRRTGLPNYRAARLPIKSGLNLEAWEYHLKDYPDKRLIQYLKFGFPLSIKDPHTLKNKEISNHFSAMAFPEQVSMYLDKEISLGAMLGPMDVPPCEDFHCSPLLTCPKDGDKRRVILNLSYPKGNSVNDLVDRQHFDHSDFKLRFPTVEEIAKESQKLGTEGYLAKVDVARAFRNLRVDPADALKFGIKWQNQYFLDIGVAFGWVHGSSAFQMVSDAVTYIMARRHHRLFAYIDDYIIVGHKDAATRAFEDLVALLQELGLPIGTEKLHPPVKSSLAWVFVLTLITTLSVLTKLNFKRYT